MIIVDECDPNFLTFVLRLRENPEKTSTTKLTEPGIEPVSAGPFLFMYSLGQRLIGISGSLIWSKTLIELIFNPCGEFRWSPLMLLGSLRSFKVCSDARERERERERERGGVRKGTGSYLTYSSLVKLLPGFLVCGGIPAFGRNSSLGVWICSERPALGQNTLMMIDDDTRNRAKVDWDPNLCSGHKPLWWISVKSGGLCFCL